MVPRQSTTRIITIGVGARVKIRKAGKAETSNSRQNAIMWVVRPIRSEIIRRSAATR